MAHRRSPGGGWHRKARADEFLGMPRISLVYLSTFIVAGFRKYQKVLALQAGSATVTVCLKGRSSPQQSLTGLCVNSEGLP
jgi:hypothetical protein